MWQLLLGADVLRGSGRLWSVCVYVCLHVFSSAFVNVSVCFCVQVCVVYVCVFLGVCVFLYVFRCRCLCVSFM